MTRPIAHYRHRCHDWPQSHCGCDAETPVYILYMPLSGKSANAPCRRPWRCRHGKTRPIGQGCRLAASRSCDRSTYITTSKDRYEIMNSLAVRCCCPHPHCSWTQPRSMLGPGRLGKPSAPGDVNCDGAALTTVSRYGGRSYRRVLNPMIDGSGKGYFKSDKDSMTLSIILKLSWQIREHLQCA